MAEPKKKEPNMFKSLRSIADSLEIIAKCARWYTMGQSVESTDAERTIMKKAYYDLRGIPVPEEE